MTLAAGGGQTPYCLKLEGPMVYECRQELERTIIDAMRRHSCLQADLSSVREIDLYGVRLLGLLQSVGSVVAVSPAVAEAAQRWQDSPLACGPGRDARGSHAAGF